MKRPFLLIVTLVSVALFNVGGCNAFNDMYDKNTDEAIAVDIQKLIDAHLWNDAVLKWYTMTGAGQALRSNQVLLATAMAGRGGLDMISLMQNISGGGGGSFFTTLLQAFKGSTITNYNDQVSAANIMLGLSATASGRTTDENTFMLFVEFAKLGTLMAATGDLDTDGTVDLNYDNCALSAAQGAEVVTAVGNIIDILNVIGTNLVGGALNGVTAACANPQVSTICGITQVVNVTAPMNQVGRTLIGESNLGIGLGAPYNNPYCQLSNAPIDPTTSVPPLACPGGLAMGSGPICP